MEKLLQTLREVQEKIPELKKQQLKEYHTRRCVIEPLLEALGWDTRNPREVEGEYRTLGGKLVDYALKLNNQPVLFVEAKALEESLDEKAASQIVSYAANSGVDWCILTNGIHWQVYRSMEKCPTPQKLLFEVNIAPSEPDAPTIPQIADHMWNFSREQMAHGRLDALGEEFFTDTKVRKALHQIMTTLPLRFLNVVRAALEDETISKNRLQDSLRRIAEQFPWHSKPKVFADRTFSERFQRSAAARKAWKTRRASPSPALYDEQHHLQNIPPEVVDLYRGVEQMCLSMAPSAITRSFGKHVINFGYSGRIFCSIHVGKKSLRVWLRLKYSMLENPPDFVRDVSKIGHWGAGNVEMRISDRSQLEMGERWIRQAFEEVKRMPAGKRRE